MQAGRPVAAAAAALALSTTVAVAVLAIPESGGAAPSTDNPTAAFNAVTMPGPTRVSSYPVTVAEAYSAPLSVTPASVSAAVDSGATATTALTARCSQATWKYGKGLWPYGRRIYQQTYWCYYLGRSITYRRTANWTTVDPACGSSNLRSWKVSGGVGYSWVTVHTQAEFACDTPWWFKLHDTLAMNIAYNSWGNSAAA
jgi:hypothetical protein